jgi:hypothetical protein
MKKLRLARMQDVFRILCWQILSACQDKGAGGSSSESVLPLTPHRRDKSGPYDSGNELPIKIINLFYTLNKNILFVFDK